MNLTDQELRQELLNCGEKVGPITSSTRSVYIKRLAKIKDFLVSTYQMFFMFCLVAFSLLNEIVYLLLLLLRYIYIVKNLVEQCLYLLDFSAIKHLVFQSIFPTNVFFCLMRFVLKYFIFYFL